ncbi:MAG: acyl-CoA/acyl-ACP dehydrogenase [Deltaproteobacteria bacterium]|jgi:alkylation response protein AidB-like acyl-CoA dehydrogenase|nr:acyl-CoA/acyl-ACP dehydrogenase [Deltaproteobacteria bacterium]MBW2483238.1 acyl-CoA/acyl-ACP dehydrogenase [Deltaproteobacteria bacterium]
MFYQPLMTEAERALQQEVRKFVRDEVSHDFIRALDRDEIQYPREYVENLAAHNLLGLRFDPRWGGRGLTWTSEVIAEEEIGVLGNTLGCAFVMPSIVGEALHIFGTDEQKERFLKPILQGKMISAEALTEPRGGSDFFGATTRAEDKGDHFVVNGQKRFVVGATEADLFLVYCRTNFDDNAHKHQRISALIVERGPGVESEYQYGLLGTRGGGTGRLVFRDVRVPRENLIGELHGGALVFNQMMIPERLTSAAASLGVRAALEVAVRYSEKRHAFGQAIRRFQAVQFMVADAITRLDAARALVYMAARAVDTDAPNVRRIVSEAKRFATDAGWEIANQAMQIMGGIGYTDVYPIEKTVRDIRLCQIWTGTNEIMNLLIQHEYYQEVLKGAGEVRNVELDAANYQDVAEKCFTDEDMWKVHQTQRR